jgi:hypothetical protein
MRRPRRTPTACCPAKNPAGRDCSECGRQGGAACLREATPTDTSDDRRRERRNISHRARRVPARASHARPAALEVGFGCSPAGSAVFRSPGPPGQASSRCPGRQRLGHPARRRRTRRATSAAEAVSPSLGTRHRGCPGWFAPRLCSRSPRTARCGHRRRRRCGRPQFDAPPAAAVRARWRRRRGG